MREKIFWNPQIFKKKNFILYKEKMLTDKATIKSFNRICSLVYIVKQNKKISRILTKNFVNFQIEFWWRQIYEILIIHKPSLGPREVPRKIWAWSIQPFWRLDTNKPTPNCVSTIQAYCRGFKVMKDVKTKKILR